MEPPGLNPTAINNIPNQKPQTPTTPIHQTHEIGKLGQASRAFAAPSAFVSVVLGGVVSGLSKLYALATGKKEAPYQLEDATKHWTAGVALSIGLPLTLFSVACYTLSAKLHGNEVTTEGLYQNLTFFGDKFTNTNVDKFANTNVQATAKPTPSPTASTFEFNSKNMKDLDFTKLQSETVQLKQKNSRDWETFTIKGAYKKDETAEQTLILDLGNGNTLDTTIDGIRLTQKQIELAASLKYFEHHKKINETLNDVFNKAMLHKTDVYINNEERAILTYVFDEYVRYSNEDGIFEIKKELIQTVTNAKGEVLFTRPPLSSQNDESPIPHLNEESSTQSEATTKAIPKPIEVIAEGTMTPAAIKKAQETDKAFLEEQEKKNKQLTEVLKESAPEGGVTIDGKGQYQSMTKTHVTYLNEQGGKTEIDKSVIQTIATSNGKILFERYPDPKAQR